MNVVIPMAGRGSRFQKAGFKHPKPLVDVRGKPMIQAVVDNIGLKSPGNTFVFIALKEHCDQYLLHYLLPLVCAPARCEVLQIDQVTEGAACTVLLAKHLINTAEDLLLANSDQWFKLPADADFATELALLRSGKKDAAILSFQATDPKWSFAKADADGRVTEVAEKRPISDVATVGVYYFSRGADFVAGAERMITRNIRTNNEFYVCPVFNELVADGKDVRLLPVAEMWGLGTPEDLDAFLKHMRVEELRGRFRGAGCMRHGR